MDKRLSPRELEVGQLAGEGLTNDEIAYQLGLSSKTIANTLGNAYAKLEVSDRRSAARKLGIQYPGHRMPIPAEPDPSHQRGIFEAGNARSSEGDGSLSDRLFGLYQGLGIWRRPPRIGGTLLPAILSWTLIGLVVLVVLFGLVNALFGSGNPVAERLLQPEG